jgi:hypothetical protein
METRTESSPSAIDFLSPMSGWEAAARWNRATFDWVAKGWQQWLALMTTVPPQFVATTEPPEAAAVGVASERAVARSSKGLDSSHRGNDEGGPARKRKPKAKATAKKAGKATRARARG